jgi:hypothetical protein
VDKFIRFVCSSSEVIINRLLEFFSMYSPTTPVTGGAQTGLTSPTYTITADVAPDVNGKQHAVTALGGTQTGVRTHSVSDPFTITVNRPKTPKVLPSPNAVTGKYASVPRNVHTYVLRKGVNFAANNAPDLMLVRCEISVPAGSDAYDAVNIRAAMSLLVGVLSQQSAGLGDTLTTGII